jgi:hypothetical protein
VSYYILYFYAYIYFFISHIGFREKFINLFRNGFPRNWRALVSDCLRDTSLFVVTTDDMMVCLSDLVIVGTRMIGIYTFFFLLQQSPPVVSILSPSKDSDAMKTDAPVDLLQSSPSKENENSVSTPAPKAKRNLRQRPQPSSDAPSAEKSIIRPNAASDRAQDQQRSRNDPVTPSHIHAVPQIWTNNEELSPLTPLSGSSDLVASLPQSRSIF